jgi:hypothetical protein
VTQANTAGSSASSGNAASTGQDTHQAASGSGIETATQSAETQQASGALSSAEQSHPSNTAGSIRVLSPGNDGSVSQSNTVTSAAGSGNSAGTRQSTTQQQPSSCGCDSSASPAIEVAGQEASTQQGSLAASEAEQAGASNDASPIRVWSGGNGGSVSQANTVSSAASSGNEGSTAQTANQSAAGGCGCGGGAIEVLGQKASTEQSSAALSKAVQDFGRERGGCGCGGGGAGGGNVASPVRVWSPGSDGSTTQTNAVASDASSGNRASTSQGGSQAAGGSAIQVLGQLAETGQLSHAASLAAQMGASNEASPVRVESGGGGGSVTQANAASSSARSGNAAGTGQWARQTAAGARCGCTVQPIQVAGQQAETGQLAKALSAALQLAPSNTASPTSVGGDEHGRSTSTSPAGRIGDPAAAQGAMQSS